MKKYIYILTILFSISLTSQELYWYDVILEVDGVDNNKFEETVDSYYSTVDFPEDVTMTFSSINLKGQDFEETHILAQPLYVFQCHVEVPLRQSIRTRGATRKCDLVYVEETHIWAQPL